MTQLTPKRKYNFKLNFQRIAEGFFLMTTWFGNIFINLNDIIPKPEEQT